jgi:DNA-binding MarR family transcriptional regulator
MIRIGTISMEIERINLSAGTLCIPTRTKPIMSANNLPDPLPLETAATPKDSSRPPTVESLTAPPPVPEASYDLRIFQSLRRIIQSIELHSRKLARNYQITGPQLDSLLVLRENGPLTVTALAKNVYLSPSTMVGIVDRLEEKGLLVRNRSAKDRRQVLITMTEAGRTLAEKAPSPLQTTLSQGLLELPELEQVAITQALEKVVDLMQAHQIEAAPILATGPISAPTAKNISTSDTL